MDAHRLRAGPVNESILDITLLLEYTPYIYRSIPALPALYTSGLRYFVHLRVYDCQMRVRFY
jgi:hypothetical protein